MQYFRGRYEIQPKGFIGRTTISGPKIKLNIQPDSTRAATVLLESAVDSNVYKAGSTLPGEISSVRVQQLLLIMRPCRFRICVRALVQTMACSCRGSCDHQIGGSSPTADLMNIF